MKNITPNELKKILDDHKLWLKSYMSVGKQADLSGADLSGADLSGADLSRANLSWANLSGANLSGADLSRANLSGADLSRANLRWANLSRANLSGAKLSGADLSGADLSGANLSWADLSRANNVPRIPLACPSDGAFIGWKKCNGYILKLEIPAEAKRSSATTDKCRAEFVNVLEIQNDDGTKAEVEEVSSSEYAPITYKIGETVYPDSFDDNRFNECSHGIHFFVDRQSAVEW